MSKKFKNDLTGIVCNMLTVLEWDEERSKNSKMNYWICRCECGTIKSIDMGSIVMGKIKSCGCYKPNRKIDKVGNRYGLLTVLELDEEKTKTSSRTHWICQCDCGNIKSIEVTNLKTVMNCGSKFHNIIDLLGVRFGKLVVVELDIQKTSENYGTHWICQCDCGNIKTIIADSLISGNTTSCGCKSIAKGKVSIHNDRTGYKFGYYVVIELDEKRSKENRINYWFCQCICGNIVSIDARNIVSGRNNSNCGCIPISTCTNNYIHISDTITILEFSNYNVICKIDRHMYDIVKLHHWHVTNGGYVRNKDGVFLHRLIMGYYGNDYVIDHINSDSLDNRMSNIRMCTVGQNTMNSRPNIITDNRFTGVRQTRSGTYSAKISDQYLGRYKTFEEAVIVRVLAENDLYGDYTPTIEDEYIKSILYSNGIPFRTKVYNIIGGVEICDVVHSVKPMQYIK